MFKQVPNRADLVKGEYEILAFWEEDRTFERLRDKNAGKERWSFVDGPITANNPMGVHHGWGRTYKDAFQRFFAMKGRDQRWQNGFDCQGLWVEVEVEKELGFNSKRDIEEYGLEKFIEACKQRVLRYSEIMTGQSIRLGMWMDWPNSYFTMSDQNNYTIWSFLKKCHQRGLVYKGLDAMPWCPRCGTGISEQERKEGYKEVEDEAVYVRLPLKDGDREYLLVWTTTPWTLTANVAAAVNPDLTYVKVRQGDDLYYVSSGRQDVFRSETKKLGTSEVVGQVQGSEMIGWRYSGPFDELPAAATAVEEHRIIAWDEVSDTSGTGIVHIAPGCGKEDFDLGRENSLPVIAPIDDSGNYVAGFGALTSRYAGDVAPDIYSSLKDKGLFYKRERYKHDYPHCWRCSTPLLFRAVDEWYIDMSWREEIKEVVRNINWIPSYLQDLELDWLKNMGDWMISKKRYWGLALPIWECGECKHFEVVGGKEELRERAVEGWEHFEGNTPHRPWIDAIKITCSKCGSLASRIPDVGNPWLDAGIVPYSTLSYTDDREYWESWFPADFVVESFPGQFRNWFYSLLAMSTMMENAPPFKNLLGYALVRDEHGEEMHKSKGNSIEFNEAADKISADVMRWMYARQSPTNNLNFGFTAAQQVERKIFGTLWNTYLFFTNYAILDNFDPSWPKIEVQDRPEIDRWILSDLQALIESANEQFSQFWISPFLRKAEEFIEQLSNWYVRRNRRRFWDPLGKDESDKMAAYQTLHEVLLTLTKLLAPVIPFLTERMYRNLTVEGSWGHPHSVHLSEYPVADPSLMDKDLSFQMRLAQQIVAAGHSLREQASQRVRQPLAELRLGVTQEVQEQALNRLSPLIAEELNVKSITILHDLGDLTSLSAKPNFATLGPRFGADVQLAAVAISEASHDSARRWQQGDSVELKIDGKGMDIGPDDVIIHAETREGWAVGEAGNIQVALDVSPGDDLVREGHARDVVRHIQQLRRDTGLNIEDRVRVAYATDSADLTSAIVEWTSYIAGETQAEMLSTVPFGGKEREVEIGGWTLRLEIEKV